jgi:RNA polymerase sigma factor (sigma-70 family)
MQHILSEREREILRLRWTDDLRPTRGRPTLKQVGQEWDITPERVRQIESNAFRKIGRSVKLL